jgi:hypothetical protein
MIDDRTDTKQTTRKKKATAATKGTASKPRLQTIVLVATRKGA